ncbi:DUF423 domain-containing protein [Tamlana sp. I1]|uniref:DUF423 domain-containing protein n=1 Tax=Tamlana sp. I1 TaxID=2762061 RepID=UPI0018905184|nr:DUF423 domain-containing protein [Tamlana sp. I1]
MTPQIIIATGALYGMLAVIFGAFGAHALKKKLSTSQLQSFETGVKYQMYHAIVLLALGFSTSISIPEAVYWCFSIGILLFSSSIYGLVLSDAKGKKLKFLGPVTPLGGLLLVTGWLLLIIHVF